MPSLRPVGERCLVEEDTVEDDLEVRAKKAGLAIVSFEKGLVRPTSGKVVAVGSGPLINEEIRVGDTIFFAQYAGTYTTVEGKRYRNIEVHDITSVLRPTKPKPPEKQALPDEEGV